MNYQYFFNFPEEVPFVDEVIKVSMDLPKNIYVQTFRNTDGNKPFETIIYHPKFCKRKSHLIVVEEYLNESDAVDGHSYWSELLILSKDPPFLLLDVSTTEAASLQDKINSKWRRNERMEINKCLISSSQKD